MSCRQEQQTGEAKMKSIILPMTADCPGQQTLTLAAALARRNRAMLTGLFIRPDPRAAVPYTGEGMSAVMIQELCDAAEASGKADADDGYTRFTQALEAAAIPLKDTATAESATARWQVAVGQIADHAGRRARTSDLSVCNGPEGMGADAADVFHDLLFRSGRPLLMVPKATKASGDIGRHILIAWNGRAEGARAVGAALPLLVDAEKVTLLQIGDPDPDRPDVNAIADYLAQHGIKAKTLTPSDTGGNIGEQILSAAHKEGADLMVIGAYSHARWRELILGGVTKWLVGNSDLPIFMSH